MQHSCPPTFPFRPSAPSNIGRTVFVAFLLLIAASSATAADWYLDKSATGANTGNSKAAAWKSVADIKWASIVSGDTLWINGGNYDEHLDIYTKTNVSVKIYPAATSKAIFKGGQLYGVNNSLIDGYLNAEQYFVFKGNASFGSAAYLVRESNGTTIRGIELDRSALYLNDTKPHHALAINGNVSFMTIENCYIHHTSADGINIIALIPTANIYNNFVIRNNRIIHVGDDGIQAGSNKALTINDNYIDNDGQAPMFGGHPDGLQLNPDGGNIIVAGNTFRGFGQNIFIEQAVKNVYLYNNVLIGIRTASADRGMALSVRDHTTFEGSFVVANNTFYNFVSFGAISGENIQNISGKKVGNNIFLNCRQITTTLMASMIDSTNLYWDLPGVTYYNTSGSVSAVSDRSAGGARFKNPEIVNASNYDFRPSSLVSAAVGFGVNLSSIFATDKNGGVRELTGMWTVGAYVYGSPIVQVGQNTVTPPNNTVLQSPSNAHVIVVP